MRIYVNKIQTATNDNKTEVCLTFSQVSPVMPNDDAKISEIICEEVSNLIMTNETAHELIELLKKLLDE